MKGDEFIMEFPRYHKDDPYHDMSEPIWEKYLCSYNIQIGDEVYCNMTDLTYKWREKFSLFNINDPHIVKEIGYDTSWRESKVITSHGYGRKSSYFKIVNKM
jgi:hypothetical protein